MSLFILWCFFPFFFPPTVLAQGFNCIDSFQHQRTCQWQKLIRAFAVWQIKDYLEGSAQNYGGIEDSGYYLTGNHSMTNYQITTEVMGVSGVDKTVIGRFQSMENYYMLNLRSSFKNQGNDLILSKVCCHGQRKILHKVHYPNQNNQWYKLSLKFAVQNITASVNDQEIFTYNDNENPLLTGKAGLVVWGGNFDDNLTETKNYYRNFILSALDSKQVRDLYVLIPGLGASWNLPELSSCNIQNSTQWSMAPYAQSVYRRLSDTLTQKAGLTLNKNYFIYTYDWRQTMEKQAQGFASYLKNIISEQATDYRVNLIGHSLGGLVIKSYLNQYPQNIKLGKVITVGTPHLGTPLVYPLWEGGEINNEDLAIKIAVQTLLAYCQINKNTSNKEIVQLNVPSLKDLFPLFPFLEEQNALKPLSDMFVKNDWLLKVNDLSLNSQLITIASTGLETLQKIKVQSDPNWLDGKPLEYLKEKTGDGTILENSSSLENPVVLDGITHAGLVFEDSGIKTILSKLNLNYDELAENETTKPSIVKTIPKVWEKYKKNVWKRYKLKGKISGSERDRTSDLLDVNETLYH